MSLHEEGERWTRAGRGDALQTMVQFCRLLRENGLEVTPAETLDAARALLFVEIHERESFRSAMRAVLVKRSEDYTVFDLLFERFWTERGEEGSVNPAGRSAYAGDQPAHDQPTGDNSRLKRSGRDDLRPGTHNQEEDLAGRALLKKSDETPAEELLAIYSPVERLGVKHFGNLTAENPAKLKRGLKRFGRIMATRPGRRLTPSRVGELDLRRTLRANLGGAGQLVELRRRSRKISRARMVLLCDISGSMDAYSDRLLKLLYYACNAIHHTEVFAFSTRLVRMNRYLQGVSLRRASEMVSKHVDFWSGGTRIGSALGALLKHHPSVLRPYSVLVIISDGWELDDLDILETNLSEIRRRIDRIVWLNPLADSPHFQPLTGGLKTAMPYVDILAGLDILAETHEFERVFGKSVGSPTGSVPSQPFIRRGRIKGLEGRV